MVPHPRRRIPGGDRRLTLDRMKRLICSLLVVGAVLTARAQGLPPESFGGALWGAMLGGIIGSDCHHGFSGTGAAIGAGVGFIAGTIAGESRRNSGEPYPAYATVSVSAGYPACGSPYVYYAPNAYCAPGYYYRPVGPAFAVSTTVVATGNSGNTTRGESQPVAAQPTPAATASENSTPQTTTASSAQPQSSQEQPVVQSSATPSTSATFAARQIPDAPRVPEAPTF